jgi:p-aminobenzoyl-glutamate transporter AbgT
VERAGNLLPEPAMIFLWLIGILMVLSAIASWAGLSASLNYTGKEAPQWGNSRMACSPIARPACSMKRMSRGC